MRRAGIIAFTVMAVAAAIWIYSACAVNNKVNFLTPGPGAWIIYPSPPQIVPFEAKRMTAVFRREFQVAAKPSAATAAWRCLKEGELFVNGIAVAKSSASEWKRASRAEIAGLLRAGTNVIEVRVDCSDGPPALSLAARGDDFALESDGSWNCSLAGAVWQPALLAAHSPSPAPGNWLYGAETAGGSWRKIWPTIAIFGVAALALLIACRKFSLAAQSRFNPVMLGVIAVAWLALFLHNLPLIPGGSGFDSPEHMEFIGYIQEHHSLPNPKDGWEFFQAPLYYILGAGWLSLFGASAANTAGEHLMGLLNMALVACELMAVYASLKSLFPNQKPRVLIGWLMAAFVPAQLYLTYFPTNEILAGVLTTVSFWLCLQIIRSGSASIRLHAALGLALGASLAAKASALIAVALAFFAIALNSCRTRPPVSKIIQRAGICFGLCALIGGWHYYRLWRQFGNPLVANWDAAVRAPWWQQPGYHTASYYLTFGRGLAQPYFSSFQSFWDGLYSTWWGDGLLSGAWKFDRRLPWNYDFMTASYALAVVPTALALTGLWRAVRNGFQGRREWLFLLAAAAFYGWAIFVLTLKVPIHSVTKSFFALPAIIPFAAFIILGLESWLKLGKKIEYLLYSWLAVWLASTYAAFWILPDSAETRLSLAERARPVNKPEQRAIFEDVLSTQPDNARVILDLARTDDDSKQAIARLEKAAQTRTNVMIDTDLALRLGEDGRTEEALAWARRACALSMDYAPAPVLLCSLSLRAGQNEQAASAGSWALRVSPQNADLQLYTGLACMRLKRYEEAAPRFADAVEFAPQNPDAHFWRGMALWSVGRNPMEAREEVATAVRLVPQNAKWKAALDEMSKP